MSKLSREARRRIYEEERARLAEERRQAEERAVAAMSPEERRKIHSDETNRRRDKIAFAIMAILGLAVAYYYGLEHFRQEMVLEGRLLTQPRSDDSQIAKLDAEFFAAGRLRRQQDIEALERWMPWRW